MSTRIAAATLALTTDSSGFNKGLKEAQEKTKSVKKDFEELGSVSNLTADKITNLGSSSGLTGASIASLATPIGLATAASAALAIAVTGSAVAMMAAVKASTAYADSIRDASIETGLTTQNMAALKYAAEQNGTTFEEVSTGLKFLAKNFTEAAAGGAAQLAAFNKIGISSRDLKAANGDLNTVLRMVMDRFKEMPDGAAKSTAMLDLMGRSGVKLTELMSQGAAGLDAFAAKTRAFGTDVSDGGKAADDYRDALNDLDQAILGLEISLGAKLIPTLTDLIKTTSDAVVGFRPLASTISDLAATALHYVGGLAFLVGGNYKMAESAKAAAPAVVDLTGTVVDLTTGVVTLGNKFKALDEAGYLEWFKKEAEKAEKRLDAVYKAQGQSSRLADAAIADLEREEAARQAYSALLKKYADEDSAAIVSAINKLEDFDKKMMAARAEFGKETEGRLNEETKAVDDNLAAQQGSQKAAIREHAAEQKKAAEAYQRIWEQATANVTSDIVRGLDDVIFHAKGFGSAMKEIAKSTAESMFDAFLTGLISPLTSALSSLGRGIAGILFGGGAGGGGGIGGILSGAAGGGGGLVNTGGGIAAGAISLGSWGGTTITPGAAVAGSSTTGSGLLGATHALLTNPWTAVVAAGIIGVTAWIKSQAHHEANTWVKRQNAFDSAMAAAASLNQKHGLVAGYLADLKAFAGGGSDEHLVATQARGTFLAEYGDPRRYGVTMPQFRMGTPYVPYTGPAIVHQGERIVTAKDNAELVPLLQQMVVLLGRTAQGMHLDGKKVSLEVGKELNNLARGGQILQPIWGR